MIFPEAGFSVKQHLTGSTSEQVLLVELCFYQKMLRRDSCIGLIRFECRQGETHPVQKGRSTGEVKYLSAEIFSPFASPTWFKLWR